MKRQARPFVIETKRSRKAPTNLWASTPLLQQELAAASAPEQRADAFFTDRSKERAAEPARRILQSLIAEEPSPVLAALEVEEAEDAVAPRRRTRSDGETAVEPARRGRPRRIVAPAEAAVSGTASPKATGPGEARPRKLAAPKLVAPKPPKAKLAAPKLAAPKPPKAKPAAAVPATAKAPAKAPAPRVAAEPAALKARLVVASDLDSVGGSRVTRARAPRNSAAAALLPGERWKRRLPQRLW